MRVILLRRNYRCHPSMLFLASHYFYNDQLIAAADAAVTNSVLGWSDLANPDFPVMFVGVDGPDRRQDDASSFYNLTEVDRVVSLVVSLLAERGGERGLRPADVAVISPFRTQVKKLRQLLRQRGLADVSGTATPVHACPAHNGCAHRPLTIFYLFLGGAVLFCSSFPFGAAVGAVEDYQGQECKCVFISTVRSRQRWIAFDERYNLGLLHNRKRYLFFFPRRLWSGPRPTWPTDLFWPTAPPPPLRGTALVP